jgi:pyridoxine 5-phosphate synthase
MKRLGVNIDHVATIRNARGAIHPDPLISAKFAVKCGANSITIHLREDRRHIKDNDLKFISRVKNILLNLEIAADLKMLKIAIKNNPNYVCIVPEKRKEITTEGGLNLKKNVNKIKKIILKLKKNKIRTSLFIDPSINNVKISAKLNADCIEIHTGKFSELVKNNKNYINEFIKIKKCSRLGKNLGLEVHAGHGLDYKSTKILNKITEIKEFNIGHFIIGESIFYGLKKVIKNFKKILIK